MEDFKKLEQINEPDERNLHFCVQDLKTGLTRELSLSDIYKSVADIELLNSVPKDVLSNFNIAKNLAVYSWHSYSFHQISEMKAYSTVEQALKIRLGITKYISFSKLINDAIDFEVIQDRAFSHIKYNEGDESTKYCSILQQTMPKLRNALAHGSKDLYPGSISTLQITANFINQLFEPGWKEKNVYKDYYSKLRNKYLPEKLKIIFILESPPISGKYFYNETGKKSEPLFNELMKFLHYKPINKKDGLDFFKNSGFFLVDATYKPVNHLKGKKRDEAIMSDFDELVADLKQLSSDKHTPVILVKANVCRLLERKLVKLGFNVLNNNSVIPFPSTGQQKRFHTEINKVLNI